MIQSPKFALVTVDLPSVTIKVTVHFLKVPFDNFRPFLHLSGPLYPKLSTCFEGARLTQRVQPVTADRLFLGHKGRVNL